MICVSIGNCTVEECIKALKDIPFAEIRIDLININLQDIKKIFSSSKAKLIATYRKSETSTNEKRAELLSAAIEAGASYIDLDIEEAEEFKNTVKKAREKHCKLILSFHDYNRTPPKAELEQIVDWCFSSGADIAKIACKINDSKENARLLSLLDSGKSIIVIGMGKKGKITRLVSQFLGSPFTFASLAKGKETAEGQIAKDELSNAIESLSKYI